MGMKGASPPDYEETQLMTYWPRPLARPGQPIHFSDSKEGSRPLQQTEALHPDTYKLPVSFERDSGSLQAL